MKIEMCEDARIAVIVSTIVLVAGTLILGGCHEYETTRREAIKAGMVESQLGGSAGTYWTKP